MLGSQTKVQKATRQPHLLANTHADIIQSNDTPTTKHRNNGGDDQPPIAPTTPIGTMLPSIPQNTFSEMLTVRSSAATIAQTVYEFYREFTKKDSIMTIDHKGHTLDLEGTQIEEIHAFLQHKKNS